MHTYSIYQSVARRSFRKVESGTYELKAPVSAVIADDPTDDIDEFDASLDAAGDQAELTLPAGTTVYLRANAPFVNRKDDANGRPDGAWVFVTLEPSDENASF